MKIDLFEPLVEAVIRAKIVMNNRIGQTLTREFNLNDQMGRSFAGFRRSNNRQSAGIVTSSVNSATPVFSFPFGRNAVATGLKSLSNEGLRVAIAKSPLLQRHGESIGRITYWQLAHQGVEHA